MKEESNKSSCKKRQIKVAQNQLNNNFLRMSMKSLYLM